MKFFSMVSALFLILILHTGCSRVVMSSQKEWKFNSRQNEHSSETENDGPSDVIELEPLIASLSDGKKNRFCRLRITLHTHEGYTSADLTPPLIFNLRTKLTTVLSQKKSYELRSVEGQAKLEQEFKRAMKKEDEKHLLQDVYITDLIIGE